MKRSALVVGLAATALLATNVAGAAAKGDHHRRGGNYDPAYNPAKVTRSIQLPGDRVFPEGVTLDRQGGIFVGSSQDGTIYRANRRAPTAEVFLPAGSDGRTSAIGMKVDRSGRLIVAGGATGDVFVYDSASKALITKLDNGKATGQTFLNDVAIGQTGDAYVTDSTDPVIYRVPAATLASPAGTTAPERWLELAGTPFGYQAGFNANGIVATRNGQYLLVVQANTGKLFRVEIANKTVTEVALGGRPLTGGDGMILKGRKLWVVRQGQLDILRMNDSYTAASYLRSITDPTFDSPTTAALDGKRLYVVNSQFGRRATGPVLPFTVSLVKLHHHR